MRQVFEEMHLSYARGEKLFYMPEEWDDDNFKNGCVDIGCFNGLNIICVWSRINGWRIRYWIWQHDFAFACKLNFYVAVTYGYFGFLAQLVRVPGS